MADAEDAVVDEEVQPDVLVLVVAAEVDRAVVVVPEADAEAAEVVAAHPEDVRICVHQFFYVDSFLSFFLHLIC